MIILVLRKKMEEKQKLEMEKQQKKLKAIDQPSSSSLKPTEKEVSEIVSDTDLTSGLLDFVQEKIEKSANIIKFQDQKKFLTIYFFSNLSSMKNSICRKNGLNWLFNLIKGNRFLEAKSADFIRQRLRLIFNFFSY